MTPPTARHQVRDDEARERARLGDHEHDGLSETVA
jgi:hypothetical protein